MSIKNYQGSLLAANPGNPRDGLYGSVILVLNNGDAPTIGIQINARIIEMGLKHVTDGLGMPYSGDDPLYRGGNMDTGKVHVLHSPDWQGINTIKINDELSVTNDISILAAISNNEGPEHFRACVGFWAWDPGLLELQITAKQGITDVQHRWELITADTEHVFGKEGVEQWYDVLQTSASQQAANWF